MKKARACHQIGYMQGEQLLIVFGDRCLSLYSLRHCHRSQWSRSFIDSCEGQRNSDSANKSKFEGDRSFRN
jgi:hypothetical protein